MIVFNLQNSLLQGISSRKDIMIPQHIPQKFKKRFSRNELIARGKKLVFFDVNVLSRLFLNPEVKEEDIINEFTNITPVLTLNLLAELLKGDQVKERVDKKQRIMRILQSLQAVYLMEHQFIKTFECLSILVGENSYEWCKIFSQYPGQWTSEYTKRIDYPCDQWMKGCFTPYKSIVIHDGKLEAFIDELLRNLPELQKEFREGPEKQIEAIKKFRDNLISINLENHPAGFKRLDTLIVQHYLTKYINSAALLDKIHYLHSYIYRIHNKQNAERFSAL